MAVAVLMLAMVGTGAPAESEPAGFADPETGYLPEVVSDVSSVAPNAMAGGDACTPGSLVRRAPTDQPWVTVTYDDGPDRNTPLIMDAFDANGESGDAEFFMIGSQARANPSIARSVAERGYGVSNHSMSHRYQPSVIAAEISQAQAVLAEITGVVPRYFRSPGLTQGAVIQAELARNGMCNVFSDFDPSDWTLPRISAAQICANIGSHAGPGSIILLHDGGTHAPTVQATQTCLFPTLRAMGLEVVPLHQLLSGEDPVGSRVPAGGHVAIQAGQPHATVVGQLTVDGPSGPGYLQAYGCADGAPATSDLNYVRATPTSNLVLVRLDAAGMLCVSANEAPAHVIYDQTAEVPEGELPLHHPVRVFDSRTSSGRLAAGSVLRLRLAGPNQVVVGQVTTDEADGSGYVTAFPCDAPMPATSNLNFAPGPPSANRYVARASGEGEVCFFVYRSTHLIVDQSAELDPSAIEFAADRRIDTRTTPAGPVHGVVTVTTGKLDQTVLGQITVDRTQGAGYVTLYPCDAGLPTASNLNFGPDQTRSSAYATVTDASGAMCVYASAPADLILDTLATAPFASHAPVRLLDTRTR